MAWALLRAMLRFPLRCIALLARGYQYVLVAGVVWGSLALGGSAIAIGLVELVQVLAPWLARLFGIHIPVSPATADVAEKLTGGFGMIVGFGLVAFWFRTKHRLAYSVAEILVGGFVGLLAINQYRFAVELRANTTSLFTLLGGIYVVVRGLDNLDKSLINDTVARRLFDEFLLLKHDPERTGPIWQKRKKT